MLYVRGVAPLSGGSPKERPVVLINPFHDTDLSLFGVAVTSTFPRPPLPNQVLLPYHRHGRCKSGLTVESVAHCEWIVQAVAVDISSQAGYVPGKQLLTILNTVRELFPNILV